MDSLPAAGPVAALRRRTRDRHRRARRCRRRPGHAHLRRPSELRSRARRCSRGGDADRIDGVHAALESAAEDAATCGRRGSTRSTQWPTGPTCTACSPAGLPAAARRDPASTPTRSRARMARAVSSAYRHRRGGRLDRGFPDRRRAPAGPRRAAARARRWLARRDPGGHVHRRAAAAAADVRRRSRAPERRTIGERARHGRLRQARPAPTARR